MVEESTAQRESLLPYSFILYWNCWALYGSGIASARSSLAKIALPLCCCCWLIENISYLIRSEYIDSIWCTRKLEPAVLACLVRVIFALFKMVLYGQDYWWTRTQQKKIGWIPTNERWPSLLVYQRPASMSTWSSVYLTTENRKSTFK